MKVKEDMQAARTAKMEEKRSLEAKLRQQQSLLAQFADNDPERYQHMRKQCLASPTPLVKMFELTSPVDAELVLLQMKPAMWQEVLQIVGWVSF